LPVTPTPIGDRPTDRRANHLFPRNLQQQYFQGSSTEIARVISASVVPARRDRAPSHQFRPACLFTSTYSKFETRRALTGNTLDILFGAR
jgi:hypothetical protein